MLLISSVLGFGKRYNASVLVEYLCSNRSESQLVIRYSSHSSVILIRMVSQKWLALKPDWHLYSRSREKINELFAEMFIENLLNDRVD